MGVEDTWRLRDGSPSARDGRGMRYRVRRRGHPVKSFRTRREAERHWAAILAAPTRPVVDTTTVGELLAVWLDGKRGLSRKGWKSAVTTERTVRARWGDMLALDVERSAVQSWIASATRGDGERFSGSALHKMLQCLAGAMRIAVERDVIERNPCDGVRVAASPVREARYLSAADLRTLADAAEHYGPLVWLLGTAGLRVGEAVALDVGDVDPVRRRLRVRKAKSGRGRDVPVAASVLARLDLGRDPGAPLFVTRRGFRVDSDNFRSRVFSPIAEPFGCTIHDLRHTAASLAIASGADVKVVQRMLGHASAAMTLDRYGHLFDAGLDAVADRMDAMLGE